MKDTSVGNLFSYAFGKNSTRQSDKTDLIKQFEEFNAKYQQTDKSAKKLAKEMGNVDERIVQYAKHTEKSKMSTNGFRASIGQLTLGAKIGQVALKGLALAGNMLASMGISLLVSGLIEWAGNIINAKERAMEAASEAAQQTSEAIATLDDYKSKVIELREEIDTGNLSYEDAKSKREELMQIQEELKKRYGDEAEGIDLVTGSIDKQISSIDELAKKEAKDFFNKNEEGNNKTVKEIEKKRDERIINRESVELDSKTIEKINSIEGVTYFDEEYHAMRTDPRHLQITADNYEDAKRAYSELLETLKEAKQTIKNELGEDSDQYKQMVDWIENTSNGYQKLIDDNKNNVDTYKSIGENSAILYHSQELETFEKAKEEYKKALSEGKLNSELEPYKENLIKAMSIDLNELTKNDEYKGATQKYFEDLFGEFDSLKLENNIKNNVDNIVDTINKSLQYTEDKKNKTFSYEDILNIKAKVDNKQALTDNEKTAWNTLTAQANQYKMEVSSIIDLLVQLGVLHSQKYLDLEDKFKDKFTNLSDKDKEFALKVDIKGINTFDELLKKIQELKDASKEKITISGTVDDLSTKLKPVFDDLQSAYAKIFEIDDGKVKFSLKKIDVSMFDSIKKSIEEIKKAGVSIDSTALESFINTLSNPLSTQDQVQKAFNNMANSIINASGCMNDLNEETKNLMISSLKGMGVTNAETIVNNKLAATKFYTANQDKLLADAENVLAAETDEAAISANNNSLKLLDEAGASSETRNWVMKLIAQEKIFSNQKLSVEDKIKSLERLANAYGQTAFAARLASKLETAKSTASYASAILSDILTGGSDARDKALNSIYEETEDEFNGLSAPEIHFDGNTGSNAPKDNSGKKGGSGNSQKEHETADEYHNPFDAKIKDYEKDAEKYQDDIEKINNQIDDAYKRGDDELAKYLEQKLTDKQDKYKKYLANSSQELRKMTQEEVLPLVYEIAPEFKGKNFDNLKEEEKEALRLKLNQAIYDEKNKVIDLENAQKSDDKSKVSDKDVKAAEMKVKKYESLLSTLEKLQELVGNESGEGSFAEKFRDTINEEIDKIKDTFEKDINKIEFKSSLFEDMDNQEGQINAAFKEMATYHQEAEEYRKVGIAEDSELIQDAQKNYREAFKKIFELGNETFEKLIKKRDDLINKFDFKLNMFGEKEYDERVDVLNQKLKVYQKNIEDIVERRKKLTEQYRNNTIVAADYEDTIRELKESERENVENIKELYETLRDIEVSKLDDQIDDITKATEKQTKAIDEQIKALEKENDELEKQKDLYDKAYNAVQKVVNDQLDALDKQKEEEQEYWDDKLEALEKINEENQRAIELAEKQKALQEASQRTSMIYHEDTGWQYEANPNEVSNAQQDLQQWLIDDQYEQAKKSMEEQRDAALEAIDDQVEAWNDYLEKWQDGRDIYENEMNDAAAKTVIGVNYVSKVLTQNTGIIDKFGKEYADILRKIGDENTSGVAKQIADLNKQKDAIEEASDKRVEMLENEKAVWEDLFTKGMIEDVDTFVKHLETKFGVVVGTMENAREMLKDYIKDSEEVTKEAAKGISYNDKDIRIIKSMKANSEAWGKSDIEPSKKQTHATNEDLAKTLSFAAHFDTEKYIWVDENGNNIYDLLDNVDFDTENNELIGENNEVITQNNKEVSKNSETVKENTEAIQQSKDSESENAKNTKENSKVIEDSISAQTATNKQSKALNSNLSKFNDTMQETADSVDNLTDELNKASSKSDSSSSSSNSSSSDTDLSNKPANGTPYTYKGQLTTADENIAKEWFASKHMTYPGSDVKVIHGSVSAMSSSLISELNLSNGDLVVLGKQLYRITNNGWSKISGSLTNAYAKGSKYIPYTQTALVDENGEEFIAHKNAQGRITQLEKGDEVVPAKDTQTLISLVDYVNDPKNANNPMTETWGKLLKAQQNFVNANISKPVNVNNPFESLLKDTITNSPNITTNNSTTNVNYNVQKVELNKADNAEDLFRGIENLARQRSMRR